MIKLMFGCFDLFFFLLLSVRDKSRKIFSNAFCATFIPGLWHVYDMFYFIWYYHLMCLYWVLAIRVTSGCWRVLSQPAEGEKNENSCFARQATNRQKGCNFRGFPFINWNTVFVFSLACADVYLWKHQMNMNTLGYSKCQTQGKTLRSLQVSV